MKHRLSWRQFGCLVSYAVLLATASVVIHETAHVLAAVAGGVHFSELRFGFWGVNPSITLPQSVGGGTRVAIYYAGGLAAGAVLLAGYLLYWTRRYRREPSALNWCCGLATVVLGAAQLATGYLEGRYHTAYIIGARSLFSPVDLLPYGWAISAIFFHSALCPRRRMTGAGRPAPAPAVGTPKSQA